MKQSPRNTVSSPPSRSDVPLSSKTKQSVCKSLVSLSVTKRNSMMRAERIFPSTSYLESCKWCLQYKGSLLSSTGAGLAVFCV